MDQIGRLIREYRERAGMTQAELAARWPRHARFGGGEGVSWKYIQDIEHGRKRIEDQATLRKVCGLLNIPLWRVGLSEYDPLSGALSSASPFTRCFDLMELTVRQIWQLRKAALLREARQVLARLGSWLDALQQEISPLLQRDQARFGHLLADYHCIRGVLAVDGGHYQQALAHYQQMEQFARQLNDPAVLAHALMNLGVEYDRRGETQRGIQYLEEACDFALEASKAWSVLVHSYLSRAYARAGEERRFLRANDTALRLSHVLAKDFIEDPDQVYYTLGNILAERSAGYLLLGQPRQTLALREEMKRVLEREQGTRVAAWMPLDWARAYLLLGEVEACVKELRELYRQAKAMGSPPALEQADSVLAALKKKYGAVQAVRELSEELHAMLE